MSELKRFFKHSSIYAIGNIINRIGAFLLLPIYTNYLSVEEYGVIELFYVVSSVVSGFLAIGLAHATLRFYFEYDKQEDRNAVVSTNFIGSLLITIVGVAILSMVSPIIVDQVFQNHAYITGIYLVLATLVFELSSQICLAYIRAIEYSVFFVVISVAKLVIQVAVNTYLVVVVEAGVNGVLFGNLVTVFAGWAVLSIFTITRCGYKFEFGKFKPVFIYSFPFLLSTILGLISTNIDKFILNYLVSLEALGLYALALKFSMIIEQLVGEPFSRSYGAFRYTIMKRDDAADIQASIVKYLLIIAVIVALGIAYFVHDLLVIMSDSSFWSAADIVPIVLLAAIIKIMTYPAQSGILFAKKTKYFFYFTAMAAVISASSNYVLIDNYGLTGACIALTLTELSVLVVTSLVSNRYFKVSYEYGKFTVILLITVTFYLVSLPLNEYGLHISIPVKTLLLFLFIIFIYRMPILSHEEKDNLWLFIKSKTGRWKS